MSPLVCVRHSVWDRSERLLAAGHRLVPVFGVRLKAHHGVARTVHRVTIVPDLVVEVRSEWLFPGCQSIRCEGRWLVVRSLRAQPTLAQKSIFPITTIYLVHLLIINEMVGFYV